MASHQNNPAGRVWKVFKAFVESKHPSVGERWAGVFGLDPRAKNEIYWRLTSLFREVWRGREEIVKLKGESSPYCSPFPALARFINNTDLPERIAPNDLAARGLTPEVLNTLYLCSVELGATDSDTGEEELEKLEDLKKKLKDLETELNEDTTLTPEVRTFVARSLAELHQAVGAYQIRGVEGLELGYQWVVVAAAFNGSLSEEEKKSKPILRLKEAAGIVKDILIINAYIDVPQLVSGGLEFAKQLVG